MSETTAATRSNAVSASGGVPYPRRWLAAGGAGGQFSTAQQLGGALGVAVIGTVFFSQLEGHSFTDAFRHALPIAGGVFLAAVPALVLPRTAVSEDEAAEELAGCVAGT
jgi:hypothetical protein